MSKMTDKEKSIKKNIKKNIKKKYFNSIIEWDKYLLYLGSELSCIFED